MCLHMVNIEETLPILKFKDQYMLMEMSTLRRNHQGIETTVSKEVLNTIKVNTVNINRWKTYTRKS